MERTYKYHSAITSTRMNVHPTSEYSHDSLSDECMPCDVETSGTVEEDDGNVVVIIGRSGPSVAVECFCGTISEFDID